MSARALAAVRGAWTRAAARLDALPARERALVLAGVVAAVAAAEMLLVLPLQHKRALVSGAAVQAEQERADSSAAAAQLRQHERAALEAELAAVERELKRRGASPSGGEPLGRVLERLLAQQPVRIQALRELGAESAAALPLPDVATAAASAAVAAPPLLRHRFELVLAGEPAALIGAVRALDRGARPLRIERVRLSAAPDGAASNVNAAITFVVVGTERLWLSI
jgi:hypothetical protein